MSDPAEIDQEIHALCGALIATEGRLWTMNVEAPRVCPGCGNKFPDASGTLPDLYAL